MDKMIKRVKRIIIYIYRFFFEHSVWKNREKECHFGELNKESIFYVIRFDNKAFGLITVWKFVLGHLDYAKRKGYIPIIDLKNYYSPMLQDKKAQFMENAWEYYFEQPNTGYTLEEIYKSKNVILAYKNVKLAEGVNLIHLPMEDGEFQLWAKVQEEIPVKKEILQSALKIKREMFPQGKKVLGASARFGYTYLWEKKNKIINGHPIQPDIEEFIQDIERYMKEWECEYCFLAVDDAGSLEILRKHFGNACIYITRERINHWNIGKAGGGYDFEETVKDRGIAYLTELLVLSQCDCLLAGKSSGNIFAYLMNGKRYQNIYVYDKGNLYV